MFLLTWASKCSSYSFKAAILDLEFHTQLSIGKSCCLRFRSIKYSYYYFKALSVFSVVNITFFMVKASYDKSIHHSCYRYLYITISDGKIVHFSFDSYSVCTVVHFAPSMNSVATWHTTGAWFEINILYREPEMFDVWLTCVQINDARLYSSLTCVVIFKVFGQVGQFFEKSYAHFILDW